MFDFCDVMGIISSCSGMEVLLEMAGRSHCHFGYWKTWRGDVSGNGILPNGVEITENAQRRCWVENQDKGNLSERRDESKTIGNGMDKA